MKWTDLEGREMKIWENGKDGKIYYTTSISNKKQDGKYENMSVLVQLDKSIYVHNGDDITIKRGFITFYKDKNGLAKPKIVIMEVEIPDLPF